jgi:hypothetical protein
MTSTRLQCISVDRQTIFEGRANSFTFLCGPLKDFDQVRYLHLSWNTGPTGIKSSSNEPIGNKEGRKVIWQRTIIYIISPIRFHVNRSESGKDDSLSMAHLQSSKTSRGSSIRPRNIQFCQNF